MASDSDRLGEGTSLAALGSENEHLRLAQEAGGIGTWEWSLPTDRMRWSAQMFRNLGMEPRPETESFALLMAAVHPGDRRRAESSFAEFRQQPGPLRVELRVVPAGGNIRWLVFLGKVVAGTDDKPVSMLGITIDGTLRRRSEDSVHDLAQRLRLAMTAGKLATWEFDPVERVARWSPEASAMHGSSPDRLELTLEQWGCLIHPDDWRRCKRQLTGALAGQGEYAAEYRILRPDGSVRWASAQGSVMVDAQGRSRVVGVIQDVSERKEAEAALRDSERRLRELNEALEQLAEQRARQLDASRAQMQAFFDNSPDWLTLFRAMEDGRFIYEDLNRKTEQAYGLSRDQVIGRELEQILGTEPAQVPLHHMRACIRSGENQRYTARRTMAGITRTIDVMFARVPEKHEDHTHLIATARDITQREAIEEQLRQAQKMEAVGQLTGGLAHDFNNLLTAIIGNLELLAPRIATDAPAAKYVGAAARAASNGAKLTEQLLAFSRRQHLQPRAVDLNAVVRGMSDLLARTIGATVEVVTNLAPDLWSALVDATQIEIAILNLAINARDAMPLGGTLTIEGRNIAAGGAVPGEFGDRDCICLSVSDTGTGMSEDVLRSAVEPFFTTKEVGKGSGLGLSQVYGVVRQSDGSLQIESRLGSGTTVHLYLPRAAAENGTRDGNPDAGRPDREGGRILVVDDDPGVREIVVQMLRQVGYGVTEVESGQAALDALSRGEVYDLIVIDIAMPTLNGVETVRQARENWPSLRVLYITGYADTGTAEQQTGADSLLKKPFKFSDLTNAVSLAIKRAPHEAGENVVRLRGGSS